MPSRTKSARARRAAVGCAAALIAGLFAGQSDAASISWAAVTYDHSQTDNRVMGIDQFDQTGDLFLAVNNAGPAHTLSQIADPDLAFTASDANLALAGFSNSFGAYHHATASANNAISSTGAYGFSVGTVTLTGLTLGSQYRIQALLVEGRAVINGRSATFDATNDLGSFANGVGANWGDSLVGVGTFTADANTQAFTIQTFDNTTNAGTQLNAILVHTTHSVPDPGVFALLPLAPLLFARRRRP